MICAHDVVVQFAIALVSVSRNKEDACVLTRFDVSNMDCICVV